MAGSVPLLPHGATKSGARKTRTAVALVLGAAAAAAACAVFTATGSTAGAELAQYDAFVRRQRGAWDSLDERVLMPADAQLRGARLASFTQLAPRAAGTGVIGRAMSLAQAQRVDSTPRTRKAWHDVDDVVGLMDATKLELQHARGSMLAADPDGKGLSDLEVEVDEETRKDFPIPDHARQLAKVMTALLAACFRCSCSWLASQLLS
jgi:hypothetical protein